MVFVKDDPRINREGRPKGAFSLLSILKEELQKCPEGEDKKTYAKTMIEKMLTKATKEGDHSTQKLILNYLEGMPKQSLDIKGDLTIAQVLDKLNNEGTDQQTVEDKPLIQNQEQKQPTDNIQEE